MDTLSQLASNQQDIWHDQQAHPNSPLYNIGGTLIISGKVNYKHLNRALQQLVSENEAFRITISNKLSSKQTLLKKLHFELEFIDFSDHPQSKNKSEQWLNTCFQQPFSFNKRELLWHFALIKESENRYYLMTKYHHLIADGWSTAVVIDRLAEIYNALINNKTIHSSAPPSYLDFIKHEQDYLNSSRYQIDKRYWIKTIPLAPKPLISRRYPASSNMVLPKAHCYQLAISRDLYNSIETFSSKNKSTSYQTILSALAIYFSRIYQRQDIIIGVPSLNRKGARFKDVFGMFISLSPLTLNISQSENCFQVMKNCKANIKALYRHQRFPLNEISKRLKLLHNGRDTLFDIVLSYEKHPYSSTYGTATIKAKQQFSGIARYPLAVTLCDFNETDDIDLFLEGAENCFTVEDLKFLAERFISILQQMCDAPETKVKEIDLLTAEDKAIIFERFNHTKQQQTTYPSVIRSFEQQVKDKPKNIALEFKNTKLNYQQLNALTEQLALYLLKQGCQTNSIIAICLPQSPEMIISILAILKISATYLVISADTPDARIERILYHSQTDLLLTSKAYHARLINLFQRLLCIDNFPYPSDQNSSQLKNLEIQANTPAYIIFTSGSSGQPKGIIIDHQALSTRIHWLQSLFKLSPQDRMGQTINYSFDPSVLEIFLTLTQGARLVLRPDDSHSPEEFAQFVIDHQITSLALVPSSVRLLLQGLTSHQKTSLRIACCGGERLPPDLAKQFLQKTNARLFNVYGPTEATIISSAWECSEVFSGSILPIGVPAYDTSIYITDKDCNILPANIEGEILISGNTLAQGYINQSEMTNKAFITPPHLQARSYRTGDRGYIGYDGLLYFSGRIDRQIKISGYRIELDEIESILQNHNSVEIAAVNTGDINHKTTIYAYIVTKEKNTQTLETDLSILLRQQLPSYMQPHKIIFLSTIKMDQAGKINYAQLPPPNVDLALNSEIAPRTVLEKQLQSLWANVLPIKSIGIHENFFELGGDSISAISLMIDIEKITKKRYPLSFLLQHPTLYQQAEQLETTLSSSNHPTLQTLSHHSNTPAIFIAASGTGDYLRLTNLAKVLDDSCSIHMLQPPETQNSKLSIHKIAQFYADSIIKSNYPIFYVAGFSIGGITALETVRLLIEKGKQPKGLILLDSIYPRWPLQSPTLFKLIKLTVAKLNLNKKILNNRRLGAMLNDPGIQAQLKALPQHKIRGVKLPVTLISTNRMWMFQPLIFSTWKRMFKHNLKHYSVSGLHGEMFQHPHSQQLASIIKKIMES